MHTVLLTLLILTLSALAQAKERAERPKPLERAKAGRQKDLFWFRVTEEEKSRCDDVDEVALSEAIVEGPPGDTCEADNERFCFCGKKGRSPSTSWKFICGTCIKNKPFSFKIERPDRSAQKEDMREKGKKKSGSR